MAGSEVLRNINIIQSAINTQTAVSTIYPLTTQQPSSSRYRVGYRDAYRDRVKGDGIGIGTGIKYND